VTAPLDPDARGRRLLAGLVVVLVRDNAPELRLVHEWLNDWSGIGLIVAGMTHQGWDVQLTAYAARDWRANVSPVGVAHSRR
jgi:pyocin large subunit-like protein